MKVGVTFWFQNLPDFLERSKPGDWSRPARVSDAERYRNELRLADLAEPLGFDSLWTIEHHFGPYGMTCNPFQLLAYVAGRTERIDLGTMVIVLPWHHPLRVAEGAAVLDNLLNGRRLYLGFGRGAAPQEFDGFGIDYSDSRERMEEALEVVRLALTDEWFSWDGTYFKIPWTSIRPRPASTDLTTNMLMAWSSPETMEFAANSGVGQLFSNFSNWEGLAGSAAAFNKIRTDRGWHPIPPVAAGPIFCSTDPAEAEGAREWFKQTFDSSVWHYGLLRQPSIRHRLVGKTGAAREREIAAIYDDSTRVGVFGTPDRCVEQLTAIQRRTGIGHLICHLYYGLMPIEAAERSMRLFAAEVLPALREIPVDDMVATSYTQLRGEPAAPDVPGAVPSAS
jgi:alkanesulfonate monooxygenase SsuD/methylene tetrahydromethanopterin reductase-like flavin-dependent oxidoreductase (luciferase family)